MGKIRFTKKTILPKIGEIVKDCNSEDSTPLDYLINIFKKEDIKEVIIIQQAGGGSYYNSIRDLFQKYNFNNIKFYMSDFIIKMSKGTLPAIKKFKAPIKFGTNHVKFILCKTKQGNNYVINSTSNIDNNSKIEYTEITNNLTTYNFFSIFADKYFK